MRIRFLDARYAGSSNDSLIGNISSVKQVLRQRYDAGERNCWLLGNIKKSHIVNNILIGFYKNNKHVKARNIVERTIGVRFRCLLEARQLHYKPEKATKIVNVCAAFHNVCIEYHTDIGNDSGILNNSENMSNNFEVDHTENSQNTEASEIREQIKASFL
ncbi:putative nuclease HARBI1 [Lucilia cuprina]|uniref:putative nuclease HARBI1 n=1 Tax=Lucilia cuprina TaxID=7375 RepID=UPI001F053595|nr:putative nuclease HARBI1 [Lucilia cuprina]